MSTRYTSNKRYNSLATVAFTVYHDDLEDATDEEYQYALLQRMADLIENNEWQQACDITDTQPNPPEPDPRCNTCGRHFGEEGCYWPSRKNENFGAVTNDDGHVISLCCEYCQQGLIDEIEEGN